MTTTNVHPKNTAASRKPCDIDSQVGANLTSLRKKAGMSQQELAAAHGSISYQQVQKYETGKNRIPVSNLWRFAIILEASIASFFAGLDPKEHLPQMLAAE